MPIYLGPIAHNPQPGSPMRLRRDMPHVFMHEGLWWINPWNGDYRYLRYWEKALALVEERNAQINNLPC